MPTIRRLLAALVAVVVTVGLVAPADAHPRRAERVTVVVDVQGHMGEGARSAVGMWSGAQDQIRMTLADRCPRRGECIVITEVWDAWPGYTLDGIEYGGWSERDGRRCEIGLPGVLASPALIRRWDAMLHAAGASRHEISAEQWPAYAVSGHEIGHCLGLPDRDSGAGVMAPLGDLTLSAEDHAALDARDE